MDKALSPKEQEIYEKLKEVTDPEFGRSIAERDLIDDITVEGSLARTLFHLTVPFCPEVFALYIGKEIKKKAGQVPGIEKVEVTVKDHLKADELNRALREEMA